MRMSKSAVLTYLQCPYRFKLEYIQRLPRNIIPPQLKKGIEVHDLLDEFYDTKATTIAGAEKEIKEKPTYKKYKKEINNFVKLNKEIISEGKENIIKPIHKEIKIYDNVTDIVGKIDAIQKDDSKIILIDYKTGQVNNIKKYRFELALYTYLYEKKYEKVTHWGIYFVSSNKFVVEEKDENEIKKALETVTYVRQQIAMKNFDKKPSWMCKGCSSFQSGNCNGKVDKWEI